jgi:hypothetical protein
MKISKTVCEVCPSTLSSEELEAVHGGSADNCPDADGHVPWRYGNLPAPYIGYARTISTNPCQREIIYDRDRMRSLGAGRTDWRNLRAHERAHTRGWDHGAGTPGTNPAFYDNTPITGG